MNKVAAKQFYVLGATHHTAPIEVREQLSLPADEISAVYQKVLAIEGTEECLILNTCNRIEVYLTTTNAESLKDELLEIICGESSEKLKSYFTSKEGSAAVQHLFEVASGLDSQIVGETEIFGQVKAAYTRAEKEKTVGAVLNRIFQRSFQTSKWVRTNTGIGRGQVSIGNVVADLSMRICGDLSKAQVLLIGSGEAGQRVAQSLISRGLTKLSVTSRTLEHSRNLARTMDAVVIDFESFHNDLSRYDIIIGSTAAPNTILEEKMISSAMKERVTEPLFMIDLALPRDFPDDLGKINNVYLYNLDDLSRLSNENLAARKKEIAVARKTINERAQHVWDTLNEQSNE